MAPNLALHKRVLIQSIINNSRHSRLFRPRGSSHSIEPAPLWNDHRPDKWRWPPQDHRSSYADRFIRSTLNPYMRLEDMADFLRNEFDIDLTRFSISRALKKAK
ncbi:hypothetical protein B0T24DRAFT_664874 [Lasiosphaeria ovina]|uniref:Uncharacterized protein n=1 Tax=Lasiosphaeria ovina TaxID=92902 RepID=A0AAE0NAS5_9PEZI|nr:hypothetical protein B0T24DRAFT_664874 [Lasiosphaeria ovina]